MQDWSYCRDPSSTRATSRSRTIPTACGWGPVGLVVESCEPWLDWPLGVTRGILAGRVIAAGLENDVGELLRLGEPAQRVDGQLQLLALGNGLLADHPRRDLHVLLADGIDHVHGAQVQRGQLLGIKPGPQAVVALAQVSDAGDAGQAPQLVLDVDRRVIAQESYCRTDRPARPGSRSSSCWATSS